MRMEVLDKRSEEVATYYNEVKARADRNGNAKQLELLTSKIYKDDAKD